MANEIPLSGAGSTGVLLPTEQGEILTNGLLSEAGALSLAGDARTTSARKTQFPIWLGKPTAGPVAEGARKPVTGAEMGSATLNVKKFASIVLFTDEQIEDVQSGDLDVLVDSGVREAIAGSIDEHVVGMAAGAAIASPVFDSHLEASTASPVAVDMWRGDGLQRAISAAMGQLESNGYANPANLGVLLAPGFGQVIRDAREGADTVSLYGSRDPLYGLDSALSTSLGTLGTASEDDIVGFVVHRPNMHVRIRHDVSVAVSNEASIEIAEDNVKHLWQDNLTAVRYETRLGVLIHDLNRAVVPIVRGADEGPTVGGEDEG